MIICSCNGLSDKDVQAALQAGAVKLSEIYSSKQCRVKCGNCVAGVVCLVKAARAKACAHPVSLAIEQDVLAEAACVDDIRVDKKEASA